MDQALIDQIPTTLTFEDNGKQVPYRDHPFVKDAPDLPTFVKMAVDAHKEVGSRLSLKVDKTKPEEIEKWRGANMSRLYDAGVVPRPAASPDDYNDLVKKPTALPDGFGWNPDLEKEFKTIAHKHNIPKGAIGDLLALHEKTITGVGHTLKISEEQAMAGLKAEYGDTFDERLVLAQRLTKELVKTPEEVDFFNRTQLGNSPTLLGILMRLAPLAQADSSFFTSLGSSGGSGSVSHEDVQKEISEIANNATHPMHVGWMRNDPKVMAHVDGLYKKAFPGGKKVEIT